MVVFVKVGSIGRCFKGDAVVEFWLEDDFAGGVEDLKAKKFPGTAPPSFPLPN